MKKIITLLLAAFCVCPALSQGVLISWSQQNIENYTKEMYDAAQKLSPHELLEKNLEDNSWSAVFLTMNASVNKFARDTSYLKGLAAQVIDRSEARLEGTSRLIIWDRIISGEITFEGKGLVMDNDLFKVGGRANQLLQILTQKNFGYVTIETTDKELSELKAKWLAFLSNKPVEEAIPVNLKNAKIPEISSQKAVQAMIVSLQSNTKKDQITKACLKNVYNLDEMPKENGSASFCNPDTYTYSYLGTLFGYENSDGFKDAKWWMEFWDKNKDRLAWNSDGGIYEVRN